MKFALGLLDLELPNGVGKYKLRDPAQGPQFDAALKLTELPRREHVGRSSLLARECSVVSASSAEGTAPGAYCSHPDVSLTANFEAQT